MTRRLIASVLCAAGLTLQAQQPRNQPAPAQPAERPRLVVIVVVDQFSSSYVDLYGKQWTRGLHRLFGAGAATFPRAAYPYGGTVTCAGHTTIGTGLVPATHGMIGNGWFDRETKRSITCTEDPTAEPVAFGGGQGTEHHSPRWLKSPTFADELRRQARSAPRILSISLKPRSAIGMAGHGGPDTMVIWEEDNGTFATSSAYAKAPWPEADQYVAGHSIADAFDKVWMPLLPASTYLFDDNAPGETSPDGWGRTFPHRLIGDWDIPDLKFVTVWEHSPWSDDYLGDMTISLAGRLQLGQRGATDFLAVSFSALDLVGHAYGPRSREVQDVLARVDVTIGKLLDTLDRTVGPERYVLAMTADHGIPSLPEQAAALGIDGGRVAATELRQKIQTALAPFAGSNPAVAAVSDPNYYFTPEANEILRANPAARRAVSDAIASVKGISRAYWADELASRAATTDAVLRAMRLSYVAGRSGDLVVVPQPHWMVRATGTTHGSPWDYDTGVPLVLMGAHIKPGRYVSAASPVDIAPTLAFLTGVRLPRTDGRVLNEALK